jgi:hypothetical protein
MEEITLQKLTVAQPLKKFLALSGSHNFTTIFTKNSPLKEPTTDLYPMPEESSPHPLIYAI